jgi:hypothetical protein
MLALCRDLDVQHKTAFVLAHKLREAMASRAAKWDITTTSPGRSFSATPKSGLA